MERCYVRFEIINLTNFTSMKPNSLWQNIDAIQQAFEIIPNFRGAQSNKPDNDKPTDLIKAR